MPARLADLEGPLFRAGQRGCGGGGVRKGGCARWCGGGAKQDDEVQLLETEAHDVRHPVKVETEVATEPAKVESREGMAPAQLFLALRFVDGQQAPTPAAQ